MKRLTKKEEIIMNWFWDKGPLYVKELQELYPDPKPHFNTLSTQVRTLESNGYLKHNSFSGSFQYYPALSRDEYNGLSLDTLIGMFIVMILVREDYGMNQKRSVQCH